MAAEVRTCVECQGTMSPIVIMDLGPGLALRAVAGPLTYRLPEDRGLTIGVGGGWATHVGILADQLNSVKPRPFWATHDKLAKEFETAN